ncbi:MAG: PAS domain S-box protein [Elusimicrobiales bacterium]|nr:PAS domain S-box protein [Elusimicrobiales bacterium]
MTRQQEKLAGYILLVEDDRGTCELEAQRLEPLGLEVRKAYSAKEARTALAQGAPAMMALDYSLPDADALEFVAGLKSSGTEVPPFLLVTGRGDEAVAVAAMKAGACDYVVKDGFFLERLPAVVLKCLKESQLNARVAASEERFRQVFEAANVAKSITLPDGTVTPNEAFCSMLGYTREELSSKNWREITPAEDVAGPEEILAELARGGKESARFEKRYLRKDGGIIWGDVSAKAKRDAAGRLEYFITTMVDITERRRLEEDLRRQEHRFRELYENIPSSVAVYTPAPAGGDFIISEVNRSLEKAEQVRREDIVGRLLTQVFPGVEAFGLLDVLRRVSKTGAPERFPAKKYEDQRISGWRDNYVYRLPEGEVVAVYTDVTAEMQARERLGLEEARYRGLVESLPDIMASYDKELRCTYVSPNVAETGTPAEKIIGKTQAEQGLPPRLCGLLEGELRKVFSGGQPSELEYELDLPSGRRVFNWRLTPQKNPAGAVESVTTLARDITGYRQLQADYKVLFESMLDGFAVHELIFDPAGRPADYRFLTLNPAFAILTGMGVRETTGRLISEFMPEGYKKWVEIYGKVVLTGEAARFERFSPELGRHYDILAFKSGPRNFACIFRDITERKAAEEKVREQADLLGLAGRAARFGGWSVDLASGVCTWSDEVAAIHEEPAGYSPKVQDGINYYAPEWRGKIAKVFSACAAEGVPYDEEMEIITAKGARRWVRTIGQPWRDQAGRIVKVHGSFQSIDDLKLAEQALKDSEEIFRRSFMDHSAVKLMVDPQTGRLLDVNRAAADFYGWPREQLLQMRIQDLNTLPEAELTARLLKVRQNDRLHFEFRHRLADGSERDVEVFSSYITAGKRGFLHSIIHDISDRNRIMAALREEQERFRLLAESAPDAIFVQSGGRFTYLNEAACRLFGAASPGELLGKPFIERIAPEFREVINSRIAAQRETGKAAPLMEQAYLRLDGSRVSVESTAVPVKYLGEDSHLVFVRDISARKRMEEELLKTQKIESLGVLAGGIAHDFNNMLMGVTANLSLLAAKNPPGAEILEEAISAARSAQSLSAQLLSFSRGGQPVKKEICLERPLREIYALTVSGSRVDQDLQVPGGLWSVNADENQVKQVVNNLLINALQAMPSGGTLTLRAENLELQAGDGGPLEPGAYLKITVEDTGIGIPEKYLRQVFDPYFTTKPKGHGLGLAMAWIVIRNHGGHISVLSEPGRGTRFEIFLPASGRCLKEGEAGSRKIEKGSGRILLLEDEEIVVRVAKRMLAELGYDCEVVPEGGLALKRYEEESAAGRPFDAVILDLTVPGGMGGKEAGELLRARYPGAVLLVSSGYSEEPVMAAYKDFGFDAVLPKPYNYEALAETLSGLLNKEE